MANQVSVQVAQGEIVGLLGPNGAGKTTSFYMIVGMVKPNSGRIFLDNLDITREPMYRRAQLGIGYLPQEASVFRKLSIEDNLYAILEMTKLTKKEQHLKAESLLDEFALHHVRKNLGDQLSGGERRRTEIARALATDPKFILLDEPFAGVDNNFLTAEDHVLFIDDFLANGNASLGMIDLIKQAGATLSGMGFVIEKAFQNGGKILREKGVHVESLAIIEDLSNCEIKIR